MNRYFIFVLCLFLAGCSTKPVFTSKPDNAHVRIAKSEIDGYTPFRATLKRTTFGSYPFIVEKEGYEPLFGRLPLNVRPGIIVLDALLFAPMVFWNAQSGFKFYEFDLHSGLIRFRNSPKDEWETFVIPEQEKALGKAYFGK